MSIEQEKKTLHMMVRIYCRGKEKNTTLCPECVELLNYAFARLDKCPYGNAKGACKRCQTHCYKPAMREKVIEVMRYSGPRMIIHDPIAALTHTLMRRTNKKTK